MDVCKKIRVSGRVQGVFYRAFVQRNAQDLGITGWTRNEEDGSVSVFACGTEDKLAQLIKALHQGPLAAKVENVLVEPTEIQTLTDFVIQR